MLKYLEVDSTYRNRNEYPNQSQFAVINEGSLSNSSITSSDPICISSPIVSYDPSLIGSIQSTSVVGETNSSNSFISYFNTAVGANGSRTPSRSSDYYRGLQMNITAGILDLGRVTITSWDYINTDSLSQDGFRVTFTPGIDPTELTNITLVDMIPSTDFSLGLVFIPGGTSASQTYKGWLIYNQTQNKYTQILSYDGDNSLASIAPQSTWLNTDVICLRQELPLITGSFQGGSTTTTVVISASSDPEQGAYVGDFIRFTGAVGDLNYGKEFVIIEYIGSPAPLGFTAFTATLSFPPGTSIVAPVAGQTYEILKFTKDNFNPLNYSGTHVNQEVCYEIQIVNLILPNIGVKYGGVLQSYPYFYVEFQNYTTSGGGTINTIYSNNPFSVRRLFRIPVTDITPASLNSFLKLDKCYMAQIVRFTPYSSFKFGVYLPDGKPLLFDTPDTESPTPPNPDLQVSALFSLRRLPSPQQY
jgi:hypothetical protein